MAKQTLKQYAYNIIKNKIISCEYAPGTMLTEDLLQQDIKASKTPIRDAISRLEQEGLVQILPKKGLMVSNITIADIDSIFEIRIMFEPYAIRTSAHTIPETTLREVISCLESQSSEMVDEMYAFDDQFHALIISTLRNAYMRNMYNCIQNQNSRIRMMAGHDYSKRLDQSRNEHLSIVRLCLEKDWEAAAKAMEVHLINAREATIHLVRYGNFIFY